MEPKTDSFQTRLEEAAKHLNMQPEQFQKILAERIGLTEDTPNVLDVLSRPEEIKLFGELKAVLTDVLPIPLRLAVNALAGPKTKDAPSGVPDRLKALQREFGLSEQAFSIEHVDLDKLLGAYKHPNNMHDPVTAELKRRFGDQAVILFREDGKVALEDTIEYALSLKSGMAPADHITVDGEPIEPIAVGVLPDQVLDEDPMFPGSPLWNHKSRENNIDYTGIEFGNRQFIRLLIDRKELDKTKKMDVLNLLSSIRNSTGKDGDVYLKKCFPDTYIEFRKRSTDDSLPKLKIRQSEIGKPNNPFGGNRRT